MRLLAVICLASLVLTNCGQAGPDRKLSLPGNAVPIIYADYILVKGSVENVPAHLLLDTGADDLLLDSVYKSNSKLDFENFFTARITGIGNSYQSIIVITDTVDMSVGNRLFHATPVPVLNLKPIGGDIIDGLLGTVCFKGEVLEVNYERKYIRVYNSTDSIDLQGYTGFGFHKSGNFCLVQAAIRINDTLFISGDFIFDTGSPTSTISGSVAALEKLDMAVDEKVRYYTKYGGIGGESSSWEFICDSVNIGPFGFEGVNMAFSLDEAGVLSEGDNLGIIGNNILDRFTLIFDFQNNILYMKPNHSYRDPYVFDRLGFSWVDRVQTSGTWIVTGLTEDSPAENTGLKIDDRIITVNDVPVEEIPFEEQNEFFRKTKRLEMSIVRGDETLSVGFKLNPILSYN